jgi:hypothetical protein
MPWRAVCELCLGNSSIYWFNTISGLVCWENPFVKINMNTQRMTETALNVYNMRLLECACQGVIHNALQCAFQAWYKYTDKKYKFSILSQALNSWMRMKITYLSVVKDKESIIEHNAIMNIRNQNLEHELRHLYIVRDELATRLADAQVRCAEIEHKLLCSKSKMQWI